MKRRSEGVCGLRNQLVISLDLHNISQTCLALWTEDSAKAESFDSGATSSCFEFCLQRTLTLVNSEQSIASDADAEGCTSCRVATVLPDLVIMPKH